MEFSGNANSAGVGRGAGTASQETKENTLDPKRSFLFHFFLPYSSLFLSLVRVTLDTTQIPYSDFLSTDYHHVHKKEQELGQGFISKGFRERTVFQHNWFLL